MAVDFEADGVCDVLPKLRNSQSKPTRPFMPHWGKKISLQSDAVSAGVGLFSDGTIHIAGRCAVKLVLCFSVRAD